MKTRLFLSIIIVSITAATTQISLAQDAASADTIYEIRNYHFNPDLIENYRAWAENDALPYISRHVDVVGFWVGNASAPEIRGPAFDELGSANVTWIIRWPGMDARNEGIATVFSGAEWEEIFSRVPGGRDSYLRIESRFTTAID